MSEHEDPEGEWAALEERARERYRRGMRAFDGAMAAVLGLGVAALALGAMVLPETAVAAAGAIIAVSAVVARLLGGIGVSAMLEARARAWLGRQASIARGPGEPPGPPDGR